MAFLLLSLQAQAQQSLPPVGFWREHLPYNSAIDVAASASLIFCATPYSLFTVQKDDHSIDRLSRVTGLSETGISCIAYDNANSKLFIAYSNSNIDILYNNVVRNIPDIKRDNISGNKTIYNIYPSGHNYYLSTGLGVIVIDGDRYEVKDSWFIGAGGNSVQVNGFTSDQTYFYAATSEGLKRAPISNTHLADYNNWQLISGTGGLPAGACQNVTTVGSKLLIQKNDSIYVQDVNSWNFLYADGFSFTATSSTGGMLQICEEQNSVGRVVFLNPDGTVSRILSQATPLSLPRKAILDNNEPWVADQYGGLSHFTATGYEQYKPNSPESIASGQLCVSNGIFHAASGAVNDSWNYQYNGDGIFNLVDGTWDNINRYRFPVLDTLLDFIALTVDPVDGSLWAGSYGGGLLHIRPGPVFDIIKQQYLGVTIGDPGSYRVGGLTFDKNNNLWIANYGAAQPLRVKKQDNTWYSFAVPFLLNENAMGPMIADDFQHLWIVSPKGNGVLCYDPGSSLESIGDDHWRLYAAGPGNGNLPSADVRCVAKDRDGFIWIGTADGIGVIQCAEQVFSGSGCEAIKPIAQQGGFSNYLFKGLAVQSIAVDGANRKWVATRNGVWLISPSGDKIIYQFTEDNSPLLSSEVSNIAIDGSNGEVFFATKKGICSFRGTATEPEETKKELLVFPNPVPPGYTGSIAIRGLTEGSIVKITELDGRLVYQTRALGGQAIWDGKDYRGNKRSSGVYLVLASNEEKTVNSSARIVFLSK